jgi:hypothetical protein
MEAAAEAFDVVFVEVALAAQDFGDDAERAEDIGEVFLEEAVLVHEKLKGFEGLCTGDDDFVQGMAAGSGARKARHNCYNRVCAGMRNAQSGCEG